MVNKCSSIDIKTAKDYGTDQIQKALLELIKVFHAFCIKNDIQYSLYAGSCLGAVRHKGFIPWDDDLDICLDRDNYKKLIKKIGKCQELRMHQTIWINRIESANAVLVSGYTPTLDVFVIDNYPDNKLVGRWKVFLLSMLQGMLKEELNYREYSLKNKILIFSTHIIGKIFATEKMQEWYDKVSRIGEKSDTRCVHCSNEAFKWIRAKYPSNTWKKVELIKFEDAELYNTHNYDNYLTPRYGKYMELPPEEDRHPQLITGNKQSF